MFVENGRSLRISNVHDFQSAGWGTAIYDLQQAEGEYIAKPGSEYFETGYIDGLYISIDPQPFGGFNSPAKYNLLDDSELWLVIWTVA